MTDKPRIVSSPPLVSEKAGDLSELEFSLILSTHAFNRWVVRCMRAAGMPDLSVLDILVLHNVNAHERDKSLSEISFVLNVEDNHLVNYALKKLRKMGLVMGIKRGKEVHYATSDEGRQMCQRYREIREICLVETFERLGVKHQDLGDVAKTLRAISGVYDQASRAASTI